MRVQGDNNPGTHSIHAQPGKPGHVCVRLYENAHEAETGWEYDEYQLIVPEASAADVAEHIEDWLLTAKSLEAPRGTSAYEDTRDALSLLSVAPEDGIGYIPAARRKATAIKEVTTVLTDDQVISADAAFFPIWTSDWTGKRGEIVLDEGGLWRALHDVIVGAQNTKPSTSPSMWMKVANPADEYPEWVQPVGDMGLYKIGDKVTHKGKRWVSTHPANVWEPGVYGWEEQKA